MSSVNLKHGHHGPRRAGGRVGGESPQGDAERTFRFLGPGHAWLTVDMMGRQRMADGRRLRTWSFGRGFNNDRSVPSPVIEGIEGEMLEVTLFSMMPHTIHFHGLDVDQRNDGVPSTSGFVAHGHGGGGHGGGGHGGGHGGMDFGRVEGYDNLGSPFTYRFVAPHAGTYAYHCHVDTVLHFEMGMYGTVIIRPPGGLANVVWDGGPAFDREYIWHLHTFDSSWHDETVSSRRTVRHRPDYFMINGKDGANAFSDRATAINGAPGDRILIRSNNMGYQPALIQLGGLPFQVIASDGRPLPASFTTDQQLVAPGERYDLLVQLPSVGDWDAQVNYFDIGLRRSLGVATTSITAR